MMDANKRIRGYLVVLKTFEALRQPVLNPRYQGVDRIPAWPPCSPDEDEAMEAYVFGKYKDDESDVILTLHAANRLLELFSKSQREFEIIYVSNQPPWTCAEINAVKLGFDVAGCGGDFSSLLGDFTEDAAFVKYVSNLNEFGLFNDAKTAADFLAVYRLHRLPDWDLPLSVFHIWRLIEGLCPVLS